MHVVTGAAGFIGSHLVDGLLARGLPVAACVRPGEDRRWLEGKRVEIREIDVTDPATLGPAVRDAEVIYHLAGATRTASDQAFVDVNVEGTRNVARAALDHAGGLRRFLHLSSTTAIGPTREGRPVWEDDDPRPASPYGRSKLLGERALAELPELPWVVVRPSAVYGPRDLSFLTLFRLGHRRWFFYVGGGRRKTSFVHVSDVVSGILLAVEHGADHRAYHVTGDAEDWHGIGRALRYALGHGVVPVPLPAPLVWSVGEVMELRHHVTGLDNVINRRKAREMLLPGWTCSGRRAADELGFRAAYGLDEGYADAVAWYREHDWLGGPSPHARIAASTV